MAKVKLSKEVLKFFADAANLSEEFQTLTLYPGLLKFREILEEEHTLDSNLKKFLSTIIKMAKGTEESYHDLLLQRPRYEVARLRDAKEIAELRGVIALMKGERREASLQGEIVLRFEAFLEEAERFSKDHPELKLMEDPDED